MDFIVNRKGIRPDDEKVIAIRAPVNVRQARGLLGLASWYHRFVPNFTEKLLSIVALTKSMLALSGQKNVNKLSIF